MIDEKRLSSLLEFGGVSGREEQIISYLQKKLASKNLKYERDNLGSLYYIFKSKKNPTNTKVFIDAHIDEVGFYITEIKNNGLIKFEAQGGIKVENIISQSVSVINSDNKKFDGVVLESKDEKPKLENLLIDLGFKNKDEVIKNGIKIGNQITFNFKTIFNNERVIGKSIDNRLGTYIVFQLIEKLAKNGNKFDYDIIIGFSTQEEVGLRGVRGSAYKFNPDFAIVVDISPIQNINLESEPEGILGGGTLLRHKDFYTIYSRSLIFYLKNLMKKNNIKYQNYISLGGTNAGIVHILKSGIPTISIGLPARNIHTIAAVFDKNDLDETQKLLEKLLDDLNANKIKKLSKR